MHVDVKQKAEKEEEEESAKSIVVYWLLIIVRSYNLKRLTLLLTGARILK